MPKVTLLPSGKVIDVNANDNLMEQLRAHGVYIKSGCGGYASCSDCIVKIVSGEDHLSSPPFQELQLLGNVFHITKERLSCQVTVSGDITVDISDHEKGSHEEALRNKTSNFLKKKPVTKVRKKEEVEQVLEERRERVESKKADRQEKDDKWFKHWEKDKDENYRKAQGGRRRPKLFRTDNLESEESSEKRAEGRRNFGQRFQKTEGERPRRNFNMDKRRSEEGGDRAARRSGSARGRPGQNKESGKRNFSAKKRPMNRKK